MRNFRIRHALSALAIPVLFVGVMIFGLILVLMMIFRPQGILPAKRRIRELSEP